MSNNLDKILLPFVDCRINRFPMRPLCRSRRVMTPPTPWTASPLVCWHYLCLSLISCQGNLSWMISSPPSTGSFLSLIPFWLRTWLNSSYKTDQIHPCTTHFYHAACEGASSGFLCVTDSKATLRCFPEYEDRFLQHKPTFPCSLHPTRHTLHIGWGAAHLGIYLSITGFVLLLLFF